AAATTAVPSGIDQRGMRGRIACQHRMKKGPRAMRPRPFRNDLLNLEEHRPVRQERLLRRRPQAVGDTGRRVAGVACGDALRTVAGHAVVDLELEVEVVEVL